MIALVAFAVYGASVSNDFVFFDDDKAILYNKALQNPSLGKFFSGENLGMYAPLSWIAYWIGQGISGKEAWGYHLLGLILHALNAAMVFSFLKRLTGRDWVAFFAAILFAVHPIQVEAVSWAAALSTVLFSTFYLGSLLAYLQWRQTEKILWMGVSLLAFLAACLSKSAAVTLPLVLMAVDYYLEKSARSSIQIPLMRMLVSKLPFFAVALIFGLYTFSTREMEGHNNDASSAVFSMGDRFFMVCQTILFYPFKLLFPLGFSVSYPFVKMDGAWSWEYYAAPIALLALSVLVWKKGRNHPDILLGLALYLLPLTVMLPFRTVGSFELRSDRYVYLSSIGVFFLLGILLEKLKPEARNIVLLLATTLFGFLAFRQTSVWSDGVKLFEHCTDKTPESSLCQCNLAYNQLISNDFLGAAEHYSESLKYDPGTVEAFNGRGQAYFQLRKYPEALADFTAAIQAGIVTPKLFLNKGKCLVILNRATEAVPDLNRSIELEPKSPEAFYFRGVAHEKGGNIPNALADYGQAIQLNPNYVEALVNRGLLRTKAEQFSEAVTDYSAALAIAAPQVQPMILNNRAFAQMKSGQLAQALEDANKALTINPNYPFAYNTRAAIYQQMGQAAKAQADMAKAQQLQGQR
ncbi:MAG: tetratricopeptide repeat protein [Saprospiraceae bacterium]|nr:tetratricopeptide repeat protein [Saprospiraceae bacterium]